MTKSKSEEVLDYWDYILGIEIDPMYLELFYSRLDTFHQFSLTFSVQA